MSPLVALPAIRHINQLSSPSFRGGAPRCFQEPSSRGPPSAPPRSQSRSPPAEAPGATRPEVQAASPAAGEGGARSASSSASTETEDDDAEAGAKRGVLELLHHPSEVAQQLQQEPGWGKDVCPSYVEGLLQAATDPRIGMPAADAGPSGSSPAASAAPSSQQGDAEENHLGLGRPAGSPEPATAGQLLEQLHTPERAPGQPDPFVAGLRGTAGAMGPEQSAARDASLGAFKRSVGQDSHDFLDSLKTPHPCVDCPPPDASATSDGECLHCQPVVSDGGSDVEAQGASSAPASEATSSVDEGGEAEDVRPLEEVMAAAAAALEAQRAAEAEEEAARRAGTGEWSPEQLAAEARGLLMIAIAVEVKAVRADVQKVIKLLSGLKKALAMAQQPNLPFEVSTPLHQSILSEMAQLGVEVQEATMGMSTLACAMGIVQTGAPMPVLTTVEEYMSFLEDVVARLDASATLDFPELAGLLRSIDGSFDGADEGEMGAPVVEGGRVAGPSLAERLVSTAERVRDEVERSLRMGAEEKGGVDKGEEREETDEDVQGSSAASEDTNNAEAPRRPLRLSRLSREILRLAQLRFRHYVFEHSSMSGSEAGDGNAQVVTEDVAVTHRRP